MGFNKHELMDFKKYSQSVKKLLFSEDTIFIEGCFREKGSKKIIKGDNFEAKVVKISGEKASANFIYKTYIDWFNYTRNEDEKERTFVSAKARGESE